MHIVLTNEKENAVGYHAVAYHAEEQKQPDIKH